MKITTKTISPKNKKRLFGVGTLLAVYSALGFILAPSLAIKFAQHYVADELHLELAIAKVEINPLNLAIKIDGLQIKQPAGEVLVSAQQLYINASLLGSLWQQRIWLDELDIQQPYVNVHLDKSGKLNLLQLIPPKKEEKPSNIAWQLATLGIHDANIHLVDESRKQPFASQIHGFNLSLYNMSSLVDGEGQYQFVAQTAQHEKFTWKGSLGLQPLRSQGHFSIEKLQLTTPASYVADILPVNIKQGELTVVADYLFYLKNEQPQLTLSQGHIIVNDMVAQTKTATPLDYRLKQLELSQLKLQWPQAQASFASLLLQQADIKDSQTQRTMLAMQDVVLSQGAWHQQADTLSLADLSAHGLHLAGQSQPLLQLPAVNISQFSRVKNQLNTGRIVVTGGETVLHLLPNGQNNWQQALAQLLPRLMLSSISPVTVVAKPALSIRLGEVAVRDFVIQAQDQRQTPVFKQQLTITQLTVNPELEPAKSHQLAASLRMGTGGEMRVVGQIQEAPLQVNAKLFVNKLALPPFASYLKDVALLKLQSGNMDVDGKIHFHQQPKPQLTFEGGVAVNDFAANDLKLNERFLAWKHLVASGMTWQLQPMALHIKEVRAEQPFTRVVIAPDNSINLEQIVAKGSQAVTIKTAAITPSPAMPITIDKTIVSNGTMLFADFTLTPQFATGIQSLNGDIRGISTTANTYAQVSLQGRVDQYGTADIKGAINPFSPDKNTQMQVKFDNLELTTLTPYSSKFAGYRIDKGKLSLDLHYNVVNRQLVAKNKIVLTQLRLGDRVDSPDAKNLPLRLAIALLTDSNGVIDLDIPISGSLDDPQFKVAPIIWQALVSVVTKVATAPFRFIASLIGGGDDMDSMAFSAGDAQLNSEVIGKLSAVADALTKRPSLSLELRGTFDAVADTQAIKTVMFNRLLSAHMVKNNQELTALSVWYAESKSDKALAEFRALHLKPTKNSEELALSQSNYIQALRNELVDLQLVSEGELRQLAIERAKAMRSHLVEKHHIQEARVFVLEPEARKVNEKQMIVSTVTLNAS